MHLPRNHGSWSGKPGNSTFTLAPTAKVKWRGKIYDAKELTAMGYGSLAYHYQMPDFSSYVDPTIGTITLTENHTTRQGRNGSFAEAYQLIGKKLHMEKMQVKAYLNQKGLTLHECADGVSIQAVPTLLHKAYRHSGAISLNRSIGTIYKMTKARPSKKRR